MDYTHETSIAELKPSPFKGVFTKFLSELLIHENPYEGQSELPDLISKQEFLKQFSKPFQ